MIQLTLICNDIFSNKDGLIIGRISAGLYLLGLLFIYTISGMLTAYFLVVFSACFTLHLYIFNQTFELDQYEKDEFLLEN